MMLRLFPALLLLLLAGCDLINPEEKQPAYLYLEKPLLVDGGDTLENMIPDVWVFQGNDYYGTFVAPARLPLLDVENNGQIVVRPGVWEHYNSDRHLFNPFIKFDTLEQQLSTGSTVTYRPVFSYFPDTIITYAFEEKFEDVVLRFQHYGLREDTAKLERSTANPLQGNGCGVVQFDADHKSLDMISTTLMDLPRGSEETYVEVKFRGDIKFAVGLVAEGFGITDGNVMLLLLNDGYTDDGQWRAAYFPITAYLGSGYPGAKFRLRLYALADGSNRTLYLDNVRVVHF